MFNLQVTLSDFRCRKSQFELTDEFIIVFRFGSIKLDIKISPTYGHFIGGKRIILDISPQQLQQMFTMYSVGMFIETKPLRLFSLLSLQNLHYSDIISGQEIYFYNDNQQIVYVAGLSIVFNQFKNPKLPTNKQAIENQQKTFKQMFKKPAVPHGGKMNNTNMSSFLYGNNIKGVQQKGKPARPVSGKGQKSMSSKNNMMGKANNQLKKHQQPQLSSTTTADITTNNINYYQPKKFTQTSPMSAQYIHIYNPFDEQPQQACPNPPMMQFTNTQTDLLSTTTKGMGLLKTQLQQINSVEGMKLMTAYESRNNGFVREKEVKGARIKIQQQLMNMRMGGGFVDVEGDDNLVVRQQQLAANTTTPTQAAHLTRAINRQQLRTRAKHQLSTYQGATSIKIPIFKDGKPELIQLSHLSEQQIKQFAEKQKQLEFQQEMRRQMERQLERKEKENVRLKKELEDREKEMKRKEQEGKREREEMAKLYEQQKRVNQQHQQQLQPHAQQRQRQSSQSQPDNQQPQSQSQQQSQNQPDNSYLSQSHQQNTLSPNYPKPQSQQEQNYQSDFQSMTSANKLDRESLKSSQKKQQSSYNQDYDQEFQSYSQSFLDSRLRLSASGVSETSLYEDHKK